MSEAIATRCGYVAIVGRPNVGKSTLLNHMLGQKVSITSRKPQTTRNNVTGIKTDGADQIIFVDTLGIHKHEPRAINRYMNRAAGAAMKDVDLVLFVVERLVWNEEGEMVAQQLEDARAQVTLVVNKVEMLEDSNQLVRHLQRLSERLGAEEIIPRSARRGTTLDRVETTSLSSR